MIDTAKYRKKHYKVTLNTDPSGVHYSSYGRDYDGCWECDEEWPCDVIQICDEIDEELSSKGAT